MAGQFVTSQTAHGPVEWHYVITTPENLRATAVDPNLPTLLLLHPEYSSIETYHAQIRDPGLRRFNIVAVDFQLHGFTRGDLGETYPVDEAAADIASFMDALGLPRCVVLGVTLGAHVALQLALDFSDKVAGLFLISPLQTEELEPIAHGRQQLYDVWNVTMARVAQGELEAAQEDLQTALSAAHMLVYGNMNEGPTPYTVALSKISLGHCMRCIDHAHMREAKLWTIDMFVDRKPHPVSTLARLKENHIPVHIACGDGDMSYPLASYESFSERLKEAGVDSTISWIRGGPHFPHATHAHALNPIAESFVLQVWDGPEVPNAVKPPEGGKYLPTLWDGVVSAAGWDETAEDDEDD